MNIESQEDPKEQDELDDDDEDDDGEDDDGEDEEIYDIGGTYRHNRGMIRLQEKDSYPNDSAVLKLRRLIQSKPNTLISAKIHRFSYCVDKRQTQPRKDYDRRFSQFDNLLSSTFSRRFENGLKEIQLYYIEFKIEGRRLFDTKGRCSFTFRSQNNPGEVINAQTNLVSRDSRAFMDVQGKENFRIEFSLGKRIDTIQSRDGSEMIIFDPELRINNKCITYRMLAFVKPPGLTSVETTKVVHGFSKLMSSPAAVDKFIAIHESMPNFKISTKKISTGPHDDLLFNIFRPFVKEPQKGLVKVNFCRASVAIYHRAIQDKGPMNHYLYTDVQIPDRTFFHDTDTAGPDMKVLFKEALDVLKDESRKIARGGNLRKIKNSIMFSLDKLFQEHQKRTRNNARLHPYKKHFAAFQRTISQKPV